MKEYDFLAQDLSSKGIKSLCKVKITANMLELSFEESSKNKSISLSNLKLELGGASDSLIFLKAAELETWSIYTRDFEFLKDPGLGNDLSLKETINSIQKSKNKSKILVASVVFASVFSLLMIFQNRTNFSSYIADLIPFSIEKQLGDELADSVLFSSKFIKEKEVEEQKKKMLAPLLNSLEIKDFQFRFFVSSDPAVNAFALPGGTIIINKGLILKAKSIEEVYGVIAHEISHVTQRHVMQNIISSLGVYMGVQLLLGDISGSTSSTGSFGR